MQLVLLKVRLIILLCDRRTKQRFKVIPKEECVTKHKLLAVDMQFNTTRRWCKKFELSMLVWKLRGKDVNNTKAWSKVG